MLLIDTEKWLLVSFQCEFLSIQEVVELFHLPYGSLSLSFEIQIILFSLCQRSASIANHFSLLDYTCTKSLFGSIICRVVSALTSNLLLNGDNKGHSLTGTLFTFVDKNDSSLKYKNKMKVHEGNKGIGLSVRTCGYLT